MLWLAKIADEFGQTPAGTVKSMHEYWKGIRGLISASFFRAFQGNLNEVEWSNFISTEPQNSNSVGASPMVR